MSRFRQIYQGELTYLRELGREFARSHPSLARGFSAEGADPDVERLLEGFAFLSAKTRERAEDAVPELCEALADILLPHYLRPIPASSIVQFTPKKGTLRAAHRVPLATTLASVEVEGTSCTFRTSSDLDLLPLELERCMLDERVRSRPLLRLFFRAPDYGRRVLREQRHLRFFVNGSLPLSTTLVLWFARHLEDCRWVSGGGATPIVEQPLPSTAVQPLFELESTDDAHGALSLWPWPLPSPLGPRLVQEYFTLPSRAMFLELSQLEAFDSEAHPDVFELQLRFQNPPQLPEPLPEDTFRLHCVPVVNLFSCSADPLRKDLMRDAQMIRGAGLPFQHVEVYSVDEVIGSRVQGGAHVAYQPLSAFGPTVQRETAGDRGFFSLVRRQSPIDSAVDTYLQVGTPHDATPDLREEVLSLSLTCTNRRLAASLRPGDICKPTPDSPRVATFTNITAVSKPIAPPLGSDVYWRLLGHLSAHPRSVGQTERLRAMLNLYNFQAGLEVQAGRFNSQRIEAIRQVTVESTQRLIRGVPTRGVRARLDLDEHGFASSGDAYLFGCAVRLLLADYVPINGFIELTATLHPSMATLEWKPSIGSQELL